MGALFFPSGKRIRLRHDFCDIRAKLARGELADAAEKLRTDIDEHPERAQEARVLLAEVLYENLDRPDEAMEAVRCGLAVPEWSDEMERLARLGADILSERNDASGARELLEGAIAGAGSAAAADRLRDRLKHLG